MISSYPNFGWLYISQHIFMIVCMHACMHACMYVCMNVCMYVWMNVCMYIYIYIYVLGCSGYYLNPYSDGQVTIFQRIFRGFSPSYTQEARSEVPCATRSKFSASGGWIIDGEGVIQSEIHRMVEVEMESEYGEFMVDILCMYVYIYINLHIDVYIYICVYKHMWYNVVWYGWYMLVY